VKLSRYSIIGIMVALLLTAVAIMPVFGSVTGTVSVDKSYIAPSGTVTITVNDADLNVLLAATSVQTATWSGGGISVFHNLADSWNQTGSDFGSSATATGDEISGTPTVALVDGAASGLTNWAVSVFNKTTGRISVTYGGSGASNGTALTLRYNIARVNATSAKVTSPSDATGITVALAETGADTGKFTGTFDVSSTNSDDPGDNILAVAGQDITVKYTDAAPSLAIQLTVRVEDTKPAGVLVSPANNANSTSLAPKLIVDFTDMDSTVSNGTFAFTIVAATSAGDTSEASLIADGIGSSTVTTITNGYRAEATLDASSAADKTVRIQWYAAVQDKAGNLGRTDASATSAGDQDYVLVIDKQSPNLAGATYSAGAWWDATPSSGDAKVETDVTKSKNTIIGIELPQALALAGTTNDVKEKLNAVSVTAADFTVKTLKTVAGTTTKTLTPSAANVYAGAPAWIFLTVPAMAPDAKPTVTLNTTAGGVSDLAGNQTSTVVGPTVAGDKQAPTITAVLDSTLHKTAVTVTITTNEAGAVPAVTVTSASSIATDAVQSVTLTGTNTYTSKMTPGFGMHTVRVSVSDTAGNASVIGGKNITSTWPATGSLGFYTDNVLPLPTVTANNVTASGASVESSEPFFLTAAFSGEAKEYGLAVGGTVTNDTTAVTTDLDIHNKVTMATATLDGNDILFLLDTQDNVTFDFAIAGLGVGAHELILNGTDEAGNKTGKVSTKFTVTARKAYSVAMNSGWNLISFPGTPTNGAIGTVLPATHTATDVLSYDNGLWSVASRTAGGVWEGTLTTIDGSHGYWVNTTSSQPVKSLLTLTSVGSAATLPTIAIEAGWNLVSVIDLGQAKQSASAKSTGASYFTSLTWNVAYTYSASTRVWTRVVPAVSGGDVFNGQGVWVWAAKAGTLIP